MVEKQELIALYGKDKVNCWEERLTSDKAEKIIKDALGKNYNNINSYEILDKDFVMYEKGNIAMIYKIITMPDKDTVYIVIG